MAKLHLIATGGTIACMPSKNGLVPGLGAKQQEYIQKKIDAIWKGEA